MMTLAFFNIKKIMVEKVLKYIDSIDSDNCLNLLKEFILVNCKKGISIISSKSKDLIQYIQKTDDDGYRIEDIKGISFNKNDYIYVLYSCKFPNSKINKFYINVFIMENNLLKLIEKYDKKEFYGYENIFLILINKNTILLKGDILYLLERKTYRKVEGKEEILANVAERCRK